MLQEVLRRCGLRLRVSDGPQAEEAGKTEQEVCGIHGSTVYKNLPVLLLDQGQVQSGCRKTPQFTTETPEALSVFSVCVCVVGGGKGLSFQGVDIKDKRTNQRPVLLTLGSLLLASGAFKGRGPVEV